MFNTCLLQCKAYCVYNNVVLQTLAECCYASIGALCDVYKLTVKDLIDLPVYRVRELISHALSSTL